MPLPNWVHLVNPLFADNPELSLSIFCVPPWLPWTQLGSPLGHTLPDLSQGGYASLSSILLRHSISSPPYFPSMADLLLLPPSLSIPGQRTVKSLPLLVLHRHWLPPSLLTSQNQVGAGSQKLCALWYKWFWGGVISICNTSSYGGVFAYLYKAFPFHPQHCINEA